MKTITKLSIAEMLSVILFLAFCFQAEAESEITKKPDIFWMPRGTYNNHFIAGSGFVPGNTRVWIQEAPVLQLMTEKERQAYEQRLLTVLSGPLPALPFLPPRADMDGQHISSASWQLLADDQRIAVVSPWTCQEDALAFAHTTLWGAWGLKMPRIYWVETPGGFSEPFLGGAIDPWFPYPSAVRPGQWVRVVGRAMDVYTRSLRLAALKEKTTRKVVRVDWGLMLLTNSDAGENTYHTYVKIPDDCSPGVYDLYLHNGGGGEHGWSEPVMLTVLAKSESQQEVEFLVVPGAKQMRFATWLNDRLAAIAKQGGGIAILPVGQYALEKTVIVPSGVVLRGVSTGGVELIAEGNGPGVLLRSQAALESLTVNQISGRAPAVEIGQGAEIIENVRVSGCRLITKTGPENDPKRYCGVVAASPSKHLSVRDCVLEGRHLVGLFGKAEYAYMAYCQSGLQVEAGLENSLVEFNECRTVPCTYYLRIGDSDVRHNLFAWNKLVELKSIDLPMGFVFDGSHAGGNAQVDQAQADKLSVHNNTYRADPTGKWLVVISGRARGTIRRIVAHSAGEFWLSKPFRNIPEKGAQLYIGPLVLQNLVADNMDIRHEGGVEFLGACVDNTVFSHISEETHGVALLGVQQPEGTVAPCYFNMANQLDVYYGGSLGVGAIRNVGPAAHILTYGNFLYNTTVNDSRWLIRSLRSQPFIDPNEQLSWGGIWFMDRGVSAATNLSSLSANAVMESRSCTSAFGAGFYVGPGVFGTIFKDVIAYGNAEGLRDRGSATVRK
jgi:hypothetical protein